MTATVIVVVVGDQEILLQTRENVEHVACFDCSVNMRLDVVTVEHFDDPAKKLLHRLFNLGQALDVRFQ